MGVLPGGCAGDVSVHATGRMGGRLAVVLAGLLSGLWPGGSVWLAMVLLAVETSWCCRGDRAELGGERCQAHAGEWGAVGRAGGPGLCHSAEAAGARGRDSRRVLADPRPGYCQRDSFPTERRGPGCLRSSMPNRGPAPGQEAGLLDFPLDRQISLFFSPLSWNPALKLSCSDSYICQRPVSL